MWHMWAHVYHALSKPLFWQYLRVLCNRLTVILVGAISKPGRRNHWKWRYHWMGGVGNFKHFCRRLFPKRKWTACKQWTAIHFEKTIFSYKQFVRKILILFRNFKTSYIFNEFESLNKWIYHLGSSWGFPLGPNNNLVQTRNERCCCVVFIVYLLISSDRDWVFMTCTHMKMSAVTLINSHDSACVRGFDSFN